MAAREVGDLEREVMRPGSVAVEEAAQERIVLGLPRLEDLDACRIGELQLGGTEADVEPPELHDPPSSTA